MTARLTHTECPWAQEVPLVILNAANFKNDIKRNRIDGDREEEGQGYCAATWHQCR